MGLLSHYIPKSTPNFAQTRAFLLLPILDCHHNARVRKHNPGRCGTRTLSLNALCSPLPIEYSLYVKLDLVLLRGLVCKWAAKF